MATRMMRCSNPMRPLCPLKFSPGPTAATTVELARRSVFLVALHYLLHQLVKFLLGIIAVKLPIDQVCDLLRQRTPVELSRLQLAAVHVIRQFKRKQSLITCHYPFRPVIEMPSTKVRWTKK